MIDDNFFVIPRVKGLNNTFQFIYSYKYKEKIEFFKDYFDYVIFDTGPILSVADSSVLIEQSDFNILIAREPHGVAILLLMLLLYLYVYLSLILDNVC